MQLVANVIRFVVRISKCFYFHFEKKAELKFFSASLEVHVLFATRLGNVRLGNLAAIRSIDTVAIVQY